MDEPTRYFVVHLQKTAGTTLRDRLRNHFAEAEIYPNSTDGDRIGELVISVSHLLERWDARGAEIRLLTGHFPYSIVELIDVPFVTMSILREPVERTLSYLRHQKRLNRADREKSLEEIYDDPFRFDGLIRNHMTRMFALGADELSPGDGVLTSVADTPDRLERAKATVEHLDVVGLHHDLDPFFGVLDSKFGLEVGAPMRSNVTVPEDPPEGLVDRIRHDNALDLALWAHTKALVERRGHTP